MGIATMEKGNGRGVAVDTVTGAEGLKDTPVNPPQYGKGYAVREVGPLATAGTFGGEIHGVMMSLSPTGRIALDGLVPQVYGRTAVPPILDVPPADHIG